MSDTKQKFCIIIPCYERHALTLGSTIKGLIHYQIDFIIVDDGSSTQFKNIIKETCIKENVLLVVNESNGGKGSAMKLGLKFAKEKGYSHALQVDADGQHDPTALKKIIRLSKQNPSHLISGMPIYDESVPKGRKWGRYLTHVWVWIETLGFSLKDSMCGFRSYPILSTVETIDSARVGDRMDFDTEIMVRMFWTGVETKFVPIKVMYPENGDSYFDLLQDNINITKMHTRLFFGMLWRIPIILLNKVKNTKWSSIDEKGVVFLIKLTSKLHDFFGDNFIKLVIMIISFYYYLFSFNARKSSSKFKKIYFSFAKKKNKTIQDFSSYLHIYTFAKMVLDKFSVWKGDITLDQFNQDDIKRLQNVYAQGSGALFLSSHYGNLELIRALGRAEEEVKYNALIYTKNSKKMFGILREIDPEVEDKIIPVENFGPEIGVKLQDKISKGEWIFCMGDRVTVDSDKVIQSNLLGKKILLPQGPLIMSYLLDAPVYSIHCYREGKGFRVQCRDITPTIERKRTNRSSFMENVASSYIQDLEEVIIKDPKQWFNFYNYWKEE